MSPNNSSAVLFDSAGITVQIESAADSDHAVHYVVYDERSGYAELDSMHTTSRAAIERAEHLLEQPQQDSKELLESIMLSSSY